MRIAIFDPSAGISGDMTLGALLDAGLDASWLESVPARAGFPDVRVSVEAVRRCGVAATKVEFTMEPGRTEAHGRTIGELLALVREADVSDRVREQAVAAFELLGAAEGAVHGVVPEHVHLHEVGAVDAVLDIVGALEGFERLGVEAVYHLPVALGSGWVETAHGTLPVPAPATARLLEGLEVRVDGPVVGEATTPTGAVLLRVLSAGAPPIRWRLVATGWGAGTRDPDGYPNALRLLVADHAAEAGRVEVLATDIDDLEPEYLEPLRRAVVQAGALDCVTWPTQGKKGRVSVRVEVLAPEDAVERVSEALFAHSTTGGIRRWPATRWTLDRQHISVELSETLSVRVKVWDGVRGKRLKPEYDDVMAAADRLGRPALEVAREAERLAERAIHNGTPSPTGTNKGATE